MIEGERLGRWEAGKVGSWEDGRLRSWEVESSRLKANEVGANLNRERG
jgi:hypothetical protein